MQTSSEWIRLVRTILDYLGARVASPVFHGCLIGAALIILIQITESLIPGDDLLAIPDALWLLVGIGIMLLVNNIRGVRTIPAATRLGIDALEEICTRGGFSEAEQRQFWRNVAHRLSKQISLREDLNVDLVSVGEEVAAEEREE